MEKKIVNIIVLGSASVGKSCIMIRYCADKFEETHITFHYSMTKQYTSPKDKQQYLIKVWDTAGLERFNTLSAMYYRNADGIVLAYDVTSEFTYEKMSIWMDSINENIGSGEKAIVVVGNKIDLN